MDFNRNFLKTLFNLLAFLTILFVFKIKLVSGSGWVAEHKRIDLLRGVPVVTSPYIGDRSHFECLDLVTNIAPVHFDTRLLEQMKKAELLFQEQNITFPREPMLDLSGKVEVKGMLEAPYQGKTTSDFNVPTVELDAVARVTTWGNVFFSVRYDSDPSDASTRRISNSRLFVEQGFITVGNFNKSPFYISMGQLFVPFGLHLSNMLSSSVSSSIGLSKQRAIVIGFKQNSLNGVHAAVYGFKGNTVYNSGRNEGGVSLDYNFMYGDISGKLGGGVISNIAENDGFQETGGSNFKGFAKTSQAIQEKVLGLNVHGLYSYRQFTLLSDLVFAGSKFHASDLQYNGKGAKPLAWHVEGSYDFKGFKNIPSSISAGYDYTREAFVLNVPEHRIIAAYAMAIWKSTLQVIELKHDLDYGSHDNGKGIKSTSLKYGTGKQATTLSVQIGFYF
jgi:hypothetical protein